MDAAVAVRRSAQLVSKNMEEAIAYYELFVPSGRDTSLIDRVNRRRVNPGFNVISDSLHHNVIITICRVWDNNRKVASIWSLKRKIESPSLRAELQRSHNKIDPAKIRTWSRAVEQASCLDALNALITARNHWLAHTKSPDHPYEGTARQVLYGDERQVIEATIPLVEEANSLVGYTYLPFQSIRDRWKREADSFWADMSAVSS